MQPNAFYISTTEREDTFFIMCGLFLKHKVQTGLSYSLTQCKNSYEVLKWLLVKRVRVKCCRSCVLASADLFLKHTCRSHVSHVSPRSEYQSEQVVLACADTSDLYTLRISNELWQWNSLFLFPQYRSWFRCSYSCVAPSTSEPLLSTATERQRKRDVSKHLRQLRHPEWPAYLFSCLSYGRTNMSMKESSLSISLSLFAYLVLPRLSLNLSLPRSLSVLLFFWQVIFCRWCCVVTPEGVEEENILWKIRSRQGGLTKKRWKSKAYESIEYKERRGLEV